MKERMFVMIEVVPDEDKTTQGFTIPLRPIDQKSCEYAREFMWLCPERVIRASEIRYKVPEVGDIVMWDDFKVPKSDLWDEKKGDNKHDFQRLCIVKNKFQKWLDDCPIDLSGETMDEIKVWAGEMPK